MPGTVRPRQPRTGADGSMHSGVIHRYEHGLGDAVEMDTAPRGYLPFGHDHGSASLLVQGDSCEIDQSLSGTLRAGKKSENVVAPASTANSRVTVTICPSIVSSM